MSGNTILYISGFMGHPGDESFLKPLVGEAFDRVIPFPIERPDAVSLQAELIKTLNRERPQVVYAYSMGGRLLLSILVERANDLDHQPSHIFLESVNLGGLSGEDNQARVQSDQKLSQKIKTDFSTFIKSWYRLPLWQFNEEEYQEMIALKEGLNDQREQLAAILCSFSPGHFHSQDCRDFVRESENITFLAGEKDKKYREMAESLGSSAIIIENVGHNIHFQDPSAVLEVLKNKVNS